MSDTRHDEPAEGRAHETQPEPQHEQHWLERPQTVDRIVYALYALCAALFVGDIFVEKHGPFAIEHLFGFYAIYGFVGCVFLVIAAKGLRVLLMRSEDYYDR